MENTLNMPSKFVPLSADEMMEIDAGSGGILVGLAVGMAVDGVLIATTGKSGSEWVACGLTAAKNSTVTYCKNTVASGSKAYGMAR